VGGHLLLPAAGAGVPLLSTCAQHASMRTPFAPTATIGSLFGFLGSVCPLTHVHPEWKLAVPSHFFPERRRLSGFTPSLGGGSAGQGRASRATGQHGGCIDCFVSSISAGSCVEVHVASARAGQQPRLYKQEADRAGKKARRMEHCRARHAAGVLRSYAM